MPGAIDHRKEEIESFLEDQEEKGLLRFITCGSVDDGKSTLIGRLLHDSHLIFEDQIAALESDSRTHGTTGDDIDLALLVDGLQAEREQGITIDVAYRFFSTDKRKFIVADTPGHEQYTRNMATGASTADLAVILIDARKGILTQTCRHSTIVSLLGIRHVILAVNKMDLVGYEQARFDAILDAYRTFAETLGIEQVVGIPLSALKGDNVVERSSAMSWYQGPSLIEQLETVEVGHALESAPARFPVQWVNRSNPEFRGYAGTLVSGRLVPGDAVIALPSERKSRIASIVTYDGELGEALPEQAVTLTLEDDIDLSRGDVLAAADHPLEVTDQFMAHVIWMSEQPMLPERSYVLKLGAQSVPAAITELKHKIEVDSQAQLAAKTLEMNEIGVCNIALDRAVAYSPYAESRHLGGFLLIDRISNETVGAGMIDFGLRRATNLSWQDYDIDKRTRAAQKRQTPCVLWFTGLSGAGKSTIADLVDKKLHAMGQHCYVLDGDNVRHGLNKDLGFTDVDRVENIRRVAEAARLFVDAGLIVLVSFISPFRSERRLAREMVEEGEFVEVFVDTSLAVCEERDPKGLYQKARSGQIANFTGIDSPYEVPESPELQLDTTALSPEEAAAAVIDFMRERGLV